MCPEIWKLMKFIVGALIWLILAAPHMVAAEREKPLEPAAHSQIAATSNMAHNVLPTSVTNSHTHEGKE